MFVLATEALSNVAISGVVENSRHLFFSVKSSRDRLTLQGGHTVKRILLACVAIATSTFAVADHRGLHIITSAMFEVPRPGWPLEFPVTLADWGLRGPVKRTTSHSVDRPDDHETLCFDARGRLTSMERQDFGTHSRETLTYEGARLTSSLMRYDGGSVTRTEYGYNAKYQLARTLKTFTTDVDEYAHYLAQHEPNDSRNAERIQEARASRPVVEETVFVYDEHGYIKGATCTKTPSEDDNVCVVEHEDFTVDNSGRLTRTFLPRTLDPFHSTINVGTGQGHIAYTSVESILTYKPAENSVSTINAASGRVISASVETTNSNGDVIQSLTDSVSGRQWIEYVYTYDKHHNWVRRDRGSGSTSEYAALVREITYR
jgi:hypothetical protein